MSFYKKNISKGITIGVPCIIPIKFYIFVKDFLSYFIKTKYDSFNIFIDLDILQINLKVGFLIINFAKLSKC